MHVQYKEMYRYVHTCSWFLTHVGLEIFVELLGTYDQALKLLASGALALKCVNLVWPQSLDDQLRTSAEVEVQCHPAIQSHHYAQSLESMSHT